VVHVQTANIAPGAINAAVLSRDFPVMVGITLFLMAFAMLRRGPPRLGRVPGGLLVLGFCAYLALLYDQVP
jgi:cation:H+ antiporter